MNELGVSVGFSPTQLYIKTHVRVFKSVVIAMIQYRLWYNDHSQRALYTVADTPPQILFLFPSSEENLLCLLYQRLLKSCSTSERDFICACAESSEYKTVRSQIRQHHYAADDVRRLCSIVLLIRYLLSYLVVQAYPSNINCLDYWIFFAKNITRWSYFHVWRYVHVITVRECCFLDLPWLNRRLRFETPYFACFYKTNIKPENCIGPLTASLDAGYMPLTLTPDLDALSSHLDLPYDVHKCGN